MGYAGAQTPGPASAIGENLYYWLATTEGNSQMLNHEPHETHEHWRRRGVWSVRGSAV